MKITKDTTLEQFITEYGLQNKDYMIDPMSEIDINLLGDETYQEELCKITHGKNFRQLTLEEIARMAPDWKLAPMQAGLQFLADRMEKGKVFYDIWDDERKNVTGLTAFPAEKKSRFVLICPGGGYLNVCSIAEGFPLAMEMNRLGYAAFVLQYRTAEYAQQPAPQEDAARAVQFIMEHADEFHVETDGYAVMGFSAGGHLAASWGTESLGWKKYGLPRPAAMMLGYPVITMGEKTHADSRARLLGEEHVRDEKLRNLYSVEQQITGKYPPSFIWQCAADATVPIENTRLLVRSLEEKNVPHVYEVFPGTSHGWGLGTGTAAEGWVERAVKFWEEV